MKAKKKATTARKAAPAKAAAPVKKPATKTSHNALKRPAPKKPARTVRKPMKPKKPAAKKSEYVKGKEAARNKAIKWLDDFDGRTMSWNELCDEQARLERLGKRYGLTKEFRENGII